jgi:protein-tyrosine phosphatase
MGAALLRHALAAEPEPLRSLKVISAGVAARGGEPATDHAVAALRKVNLDISGHVSQPVTQELLDGALAVLCMTETHRAILRINSDKIARNLYLFKEFMPQRGGKEIADPYGSPMAVYEACRDEIVSAIPSLIGFLRTAAK